jgi:topoisomerase-4 subunit A
LTKGTKGSKVLHFSANKNGEAESIEVKLSNNCRAKSKTFEYDFSDLDVKGKASQGNIVTKYPVRRVDFKKAGSSTLDARKLWFDNAVGRLNSDENGAFLGKFGAEDQVLAIYNTGEYELTNQEITNKYDAKQLMFIGKLNPNDVISAIYSDGKSDTYYLKRFQIETTTQAKKFGFISEEKGSELLFVSNASKPVAEITFKEKGNKHEVDIFDLEELESVKGWKSVGFKLPVSKVVKARLLSSGSESEEELEKRTQTELF